MFYPFLLTKKFYDINDTETLTILFKLSSCLLKEEKTLLLYTPLVMKNLMAFGSIFALPKEFEQRRQYKSFLKNFLYYPTLIDCSEFDNKSIIETYFYELQKHIYPDDSLILYSFIKMILQTDIILTDYKSFFLLILEKFLYMSQEQIANCPLRQKIILISLFALIDITYNNDIMQKESKIIISHIIDKVLSNYDISTVVIKILLLTGLTIPNRIERMTLFSIKVIEEWPQSRIVKQNNESMISLIKHSINIILKSKGKHKEIHIKLVLTIINDIFQQCKPDNPIYQKLFSGNKKNVMLSLMSDNSLFSDLDIIEKGKEYIALIYNHKESFWFKLMMNKSKSKEAIQFLIELLHLLLLEILMNASKKSNKIYIHYNFANLLVVMHHIIESPCKEVFFANKIGAVLYGFFESLDQSNIIYSKAYFLNQSKILAEHYFEFHVELYILTNDATNFEFITQKWIQPNSYSIPFLLDDKKGVNQKVDFNEIKNINEDILQLYGPVSPVNYNYTYVFLLKCFWYLLDSKANTLLKAFLEEFANLLCKEINQLYLSYSIINAKTENNDDDNNLYNFIKVNYEIRYKINKNYQELRETVMKYLASKNILKNEFENNDVNISKSNSHNQLIEEENSPSIVIDYSPHIDLLISLNPLDSYSIEITDEDYYQACNKKKLLLSSFGIFFKDFYYKNELFGKIKKEYINKPEIIKETKLLNYPCKRKHFSNGLSPPIFLKQNMQFFNSKYFQITHKYYLDKIKDETINTLPLYTKRLNLDKLKKVKLTDAIKTSIDNNAKHFYIQCELISFDSSLFGTLTLTNNYVIFQNEDQKIDDNNLSYVFSSLREDRIVKEKQIILSYDDIKEILIRRFILMWQAIEIFIKNGKSYFFNFFNESNMRSLLRFFNLILKNQSLIINNSANEFNSKNYVEKWKKGSLNNYDFLNILNKYSSRTFKDLSQYYVFPWLFQSYTEDQDESKMSYRDLSRAICVQNDELMNVLKSKYEDAMMNNLELPISTHYSTSPFVMYYLVRSSPFTELLIKLQNNQFDDVNRTFISFNSTLAILSTNKDPRELIPEFYTTPEFMINLNCIDYGIRRNNERLDDVHLDNSSPKVFSSYIDWIINQKKLLNKFNLGPWINSIFGINQYSTITSKNPFCYYSSYSFEKMTNLDETLKNYQKEEMATDKMIALLKNKINIIINFGNCPHQILYTSLSAALKKTTSLDDDDDYLSNLIQDINNCLAKQTNIIYFWENKGNNTVSLVTKKREVITYSLDDSSKISSVQCKLFKLLTKVSFRINDDSISSENKDSSLNNFKRINDFFIYEVKYVIIGLNYGQIIISCRYSDNSIKIVYSNKEIREILLEDFVNCLCKRGGKTHSNMFYSGLNNGKLIEWIIDFDKKNIKMNRTLIAHSDGIDVICISDKIGVIVTSGKDHFIYIRKLLDFELLTVISIALSLIVVDIKISSANFLYAKCFDRIVNKFCIKGFTMTGINFASSKYDLFSSINLTQSGNLVVGYYDRFNISVLKGGNMSLATSRDIALGKGRKINYFKFKKKERLLYIASNYGFQKKKLFD